MSARNASPLDRLRARAAEVLSPPVRMTIAEWAEAHRILDGISAKPGKWDNDSTPYLREPMEALSPQHPCETVILMWASQVGKTEGLLNAIGHSIHLSPCTMMFVEPTISIATDVSKGRLAPMFRSTPALRERVAEPRSRDSDSTIMLRTFPGGFLRISGANSAASLASTPIRRLLLDEVDRYPLDVDGEGDPVDLALTRTSTFSNKKKVLLTSTPTLRGESRIERAYLESDQRRYFVPCPHCEHYQTLDWARVEWPSGNPSGAVYTCVNGCVIRNHEKEWMLKRGRWGATAEPVSPRTMGYHLSALYAPHDLGPSFADLAIQFVKAKGDPAALKVFINTRLAETWDQADGESVDRGTLQARCEPGDWPKELPDEVVILTAGVDVQKDRLEVEVVGWAPGEESWSVDYLILLGDVTQREIWGDLDDALQRRYRHPSGLTLPIAAACVDSGHYTDRVYEFTKPRRGRRVWAIKGAAGDYPVWPLRSTRGGKFRNMPVFLVGVDKAKLQVFDRLSLKDPGPGYCHFPAGRDAEYFAQLTAERLVSRMVKGRKTLKWAQLRARNEALDCRVYAYAALHGWQSGGRSLERAAEKLLAAADTPERGERQRAAPRRARSGQRWLERPSNFWG